MQNTEPTYRERLAPSLWVLVAAALVAPMVSLVFVPAGSIISLGAGLAVAAVLLAALIGTSPVIEVRDGRLRAGRAQIDARWLGTPRALSGEEARHARGAGLDRRAWLLIRGGLSGLVVVPIEDPDDPVPAWCISTRTPDRLASAIESARYAAQSRQMKPTELS